MIVVLSALAAEAALREMDLRTVALAWRDRVADPLRGWALHPGYRGMATEENNILVEINSDGMRDREHPLQAPPSTVRIAVLGDSYMQARTLPFEKSLVPLLEQRLDTCAASHGRRAEVLNFGVAGYGTGQELLTYQYHAVRYRPDIVLLAVFTENDLFDDDAEARRMSGLPWFDLEAGRLVWHPAWHGLGPGLGVWDIPWYQRMRLAITDRSLLATRVWDVYAQLRAPFVTLRLVDVQEPGAPALEDIYAPPVARTLVRAWQLSEALMLELARQVAANGSELWIVTLANAAQTTPNLPARRALERRYHVDSLFYPDHRIRDLAQAHGIPVVTLAEPLADYAAKTGEWLNGGYNEAFPRGTGHWNETAHRLAAEIVGDRLCAGSARLTQ